MNKLHIPEPFVLESGNTLPDLTIAYHTYGNLNKEKNNVVWICHALTASSDVYSWWPGIVGKGCVINPDDHFIVCANILGSCYGTSGPLTVNSSTQKPFYASFPLITTRDLVQAHIVLRKKLGIDKIKFLMGGSMGGYQVLEWCLMDPLHWT